MNELILPWPSRDLHPNSRIHWSQKAKATRAARVDAHLLAKAAGWNRMALRVVESVSGKVDPSGRLHLWIDFYPPDRRARDDDGLLASMKAARDGIADALWIDDKRFVSHPYVKDEVRKGGEVRVRITAGQE